MVARARAAYRESRPRFDRPLPAGVAHDYVDRAVRDLLGSVDVEALPEMAVRPAMARLQHRLFRRIRGYNAIQPG